jgi:2-keto-4-pentenoate hydratase/2-oxohepta-3-ene-1,7-dioic acid hydratase in catechol pathway
MVHVRLTNVGGRACLLDGDRLLDVGRASGGRLPADPMAALAAWDALVDWARGRHAGDFDTPLDPLALDPPVPRPAKVFGIGLNYRAHAEEAGLELPRAPLVFTKFPSCLVGPRADVVLSSGTVDFEAELVVVIGRAGVRIPEAEALAHVAGYCVGQDISDRRLQFSDKPPQFSLGKSYDTYGPIGPAVVALDALPDPNDLHLTCDVAGERMQDARTSDLIFPAAALVAYLSGVCTLAPGDLIFTGTPSGVGATRTPRRYLAAGEEIVTTIEPLGTLVNRCVAG